jgi:hypothetical protein
VLAPCKRWLAADISGNHTALINRDEVRNLGEVAGVYWDQVREE